jgi:hypothetical protein
MIDPTQIDFSEVLHSNLHPKPTNKSQTLSGVKISILLIIIGFSAFAIGSYIYSNQQNNVKA